jgi:Do/DeqQ family serine protease
MRLNRAAAVLMAAFVIACGRTGGVEASPGPAPETTQPYELAQASDRRLPQNRGEMQLSLAPVVAGATPAVVNVYAQRIVRQRRSLLDDFMRGMPPGALGGMSQKRIEQSLGSGVVVRSDGVIVTNNHVVDGADGVKIVLADRREFDASVLLADPRTDLAVLKIDTKGERLPALAFADTRRAQVGDLVIAIGNPFGLNQTVTSGIISALARTEVGINDFSFFIQTDAAINRGNSGGALVDMRGDLVGVNTAIFSEAGGSNGIGFAIPAEMVRRVVESAQSGGQQVVRAWLGVQGDTVTQDLAQSVGLDRPRGVLVKEIYPGSPGDKAGLRRGDVLLSVNGVEVFDEQGVRYQAATVRPGVQIPLEIMRGTAKRQVSARAEAPPKTALEPRELSGPHPLDGVRVINLSPGVAEEKGLSPFNQGVLIEAMDRRGGAARAGFQPGDIVRSVNGETVVSTAALARTLSARPSAWRIIAVRGSETVELRFNAR